LTTTAVTTFMGIRGQALKHDVNKPPTTSELIDWLRILYWKSQTPEAVSASPYLPPYWHLLFKDMNDLDRYQAVVTKQGTGE